MSRPDLPPHDDAIESDPPAPTPGRSTLRRAASVAAWLVVLGYAGPIMLAWSWRIDPTHTGEFAQWLSWFSACMRAASSHLAVIGVVAAIAVLVAKQRKQALAISAVAAFAAWPGVRDAIGGPGDQSPPNADALTILSFNAFVGRADADEFERIVNREQPDVIVLQEYTGRFAFEMRRRLADDWPHSFELPSASPQGRAVFSKRPFADGPAPLELTFEGDRRTDQENTMVWSRLELAGRPVSLVNVHLSNPLKPARVLNQAGQTEALLDWLAHADGPVLLIGDFNFTSASQNAADFRRAGLRDAHRAAGRGLGLTHPAINRLQGLLPGVRIDRAYATADLRLLDFRTLDWIAGSDHKPIVVRVAPE